MAWAGAPQTTSAYALDAPIAQAGSLNTDALLQAIQQHAIAKAELVGLFGR